MTSCVAYGCTSRYTKKIPGITFHSFPKEDIRRALWIKAVGRANWLPSKSSKLCSRHFREDQIDRTSLSCVRIREDAVPVIFDAYPPYLQMDIDLLEKWKQVIPLRSKNLRHRSRVCELHFAEEDFERCCETKLSDGTALTVGKGRIQLKRGAIPSVSPKSSVILSQEKNTKQLGSLEPVQVPKVEIIPDEDISLPTEELRYTKLVADLEKVTRPSLWWTVSTTAKYVVCVKWDDALRSIWKVIVCEDLKVKIYLRNDEFIAQNIQIETEVYDVDKLTQLLSRLEKLVICRSTFEAGQSSSCSGLIIDYFPGKRRRIWCTACSVLRKRSRDRLHWTSFKKKSASNK